MIALPLRVVGLLFGYLFCAASMGSVLAWLLQGNIDFEYEKILSRAILLFAALGLIPLWRLSGLNRRDVGLQPFEPAHVAKAYPLAIAVLLPLALFFLVVRFRIIDPRVVYLSGEFIGLVGVALVSGLLVGLFEETLFRGVLYGVLRRGAGFVLSACVVGVLYSGVHFLAGDAQFEGDIAWYTGYQQVYSAFAALANPTGYWDAFLALFLLGVLFCWVRERYGLWWCIGLHAAWVFAIRVFKELTVRDVFNPYEVWVSNYDHFVGNLVTVWLMFIFVLLVLSKKVVSNRQS